MSVPQSPTTGTLLTNIFLIEEIWKGRQTNKPPKHNSDIINILKY